MNWLAWLLFSFNGRIGRQTFWFAFIGFVVVLIGGIMIIQPEYFASLDPVVPSFAHNVWILLTAWPSFAITRKRLNDRDWPDAVFAAVVLISLPFLIAPFFGRLLDPAVPVLWEQAMWAIFAAAMVLLLIDNGFMKGIEGPNRHGADPRGNPPPQV